MLQEFEVVREAVLSEAMVLQQRLLRLALVVVVVVVVVVVLLPLSL